MRKMSKTKASLRKATALCCAAAILVSSTGALVANARAGSQSPFGDGTPINEEYNEHLSLQPTPTAFQMKTVLEWTPEYDTDAQYNRGTIPKADRFTGPLVSDVKNPDAKLTIASMANLNHDDTPSQGSDMFSNFAFDYWQYLDSYIYWAGSGSTEGIVILPTPDLIDSGHRNGVPVLGMFAFPWEDGGSGMKELNSMIQKNPDGSYPVADKMIEMADYYGFDGYFFNAEGFGYSDAVGELINLMKYIHKKRPDMIFNWYNCIGGPGVTEGGTSSLFINKDSEGLYAVDEMFCNYGAEYSVDNTISAMIAGGRNPFDAFIGYEMQRGGDVDTQLSDHLLMGEDGRIKTSIGLFIPNTTLGKAKDPADFHVKERDLYVGFSGDPTVWPGDPADPSAPKWIGLSRFFAEKSVIDEAPFTTTFNTGHGAQWFVDGKLSRTKEWNNRSMSDVLPTYTWIVRSEGSVLTANYDFEDAYNGGNSVKYEGNLDAGKANTSLLYSTQVDVTADTKIKLTYKQNSNQKVQLGVYYGDSYDESNVTYYDLANSDAGNGWTTGVADLSADKGKVAVGISIRVESENGVENYKLNLGQLSIVEEEAIVLPAPEKVFVDEMQYNAPAQGSEIEAEVRLKWEAVDGARYYEIYHENADGSETLINATPNTAYYINSLNAMEGKDYATVKVYPIAEDGTRGQAKALSIQWQPELLNEGVYIPHEQEAMSDNVCLNATVTAYSGQNSGETAAMAIDGDINSKWCIPGASSGYMDIKLDQPRTIKRWRVEHAEAGGEDPNSNTFNFGLQYKDASGQWQTVDYVNGNRNPVTDHVLATPITAQEFRLKIDKAYYSAIWAALRVYEWQMFEEAGQEPSEAHPSQLVEAQNKEGANDVVTFYNVQRSQTIKVYNSPDASEPIAQGDSLEYGTTLTFDHLDFGTADAGRLYYTTTDNRVGGGESGRMSVAYLAEVNTEKAPQSGNVVFAPYSEKDSSNYRFGDQVYTSIKVGDLQPGDVVYAYSSQDSEVYLKKSLPVAEGETSTVINNVLIADINGGATLQIAREGMNRSDRYTITLTQALQNALEKAEAFDPELYTQESYQALQDAVKAAQEALQAGDTSFDALQNPLNQLSTAIGNMEKRPVVTGILQSFVEYAEQIKNEGALDNTVEVIVNGFEKSLAEAKALLSNPDATQTQINDASRDLLGWISKVNWKQGDKTLLQIAVELADSINENLDLYIDTAAFTAAYEHGKEVLANGNVFQDDVDAACTALVDAMKELRMHPNKDILDDMINQASSLDVSGYTAESVQVFQAALAAAKAVAEDPAATQEAIDNAAESLRAAQAGLVKQPATETDVPKADDAAGDKADKAPVENVGEGAAPSKTGDSTSAFALMAVAAAAGMAVVLSKKKNS